MGPDEGRRFLIGDGVSHVGRSLECEVVLNDPSASRRHFKVEGRDSRFTLIDLGSENGTCVGGTRVKNALLEQDDQISVGTTLLHFGYVGAPAPNVGADAQKLRPKPAGSSGGGSRSWVPLVVGLVVVGLGVAVVFTGQALGWWSLFGAAAPAPVAAAPAIDPPAPEEPTVPPAPEAEEPKAEPHIAPEPPPEAPDVVQAAEATPDVVVAALVEDVVAADVEDAEEVSADADVEDVEAVAADADLLAEVSLDAEVPGDAPDVEGLDAEDASLAADAELGVAAAAEVVQPDDVSASADLTEPAAVDAGTPPVIEAGGGPGDQLLLEARLLVGEKKLTEAQSKLVLAAQAGAPAQSVQALIKTIAAASGHRLIYDSQVQAMAAKNYTTVITLAAQIPAESPYAAEAAALAAQARDAAAGKVGAPTPVAPEASPEAKFLESLKLLASEFLGHVLARRDTDAVKLLVAEADCQKAAAAFQEECRKEVAAMAAGLEALRKEYKGTTLGEVTEPEKLEGSEQWGSLRQYVVEATIPVPGGEPVTATITVVELSEGALRIAFPVSGPAEAPVPEAPVPTAPGAPPALDKAKGLRAYAAGDFAGAIGIFTRAATNPALTEEDRGRAKQLARSIQQFQKHYADGNAAAQQLRDIAAITALSDALIDDRRVSGAYQGKIKKVLANMYAHRASTQFQAGRNWEAAKAARKALQLDKSHSGARMIADKLSTAADGLIQKAKAARGAGNTAEARRLLRDAKLIVPPGDARAGRIQAELDALGP